MSFKSRNRTYLYLIAFYIIVVVFWLSYCPGFSKEVRSDEIQKKNFLRKEIFFESPEMTSITNIIQGNFDQDPDKKIGIFDQFSFYSVNRHSGATEKVVRFKWASGILRPDLVYIKTKKDQGYGFIAKGPVSDIGLMNQMGEPIWVYKPANQEIINTMAAGDLDQNGVLEFYVATSRGLVKLNQSGIKFWEKSGWVGDVDIFDTGTANKYLVVTINSDNRIQFRNYMGELEKEFASPIQANKIQNVEWPTPGHLLMTAANNIYILDFEGKIVFSHKLNKDIFAIRGTPIQFKHDEKISLALVAKFSSTTGKAMLCIFSSNGELIYEELINTTQGLLAMQTKTLGKQILLVGNGPGKIYKYWSKEGEMQDNGAK